MEKKYYIFQKNKVVMFNQEKTVEPINQDIFESITRNSSPKIHLPLRPEKDVYCVELDENHELPETYDLLPLRSLLGRVEDKMFSTWGKASQTLHWFRSNRFCGGCGAPTEAHPTDMARICKTCALNHYPTISPCIIVLVYRKKEILLARSPRFSSNIFSTLAGFVEPGETAEEAVVREIYEEVRIKVKNLRYFKSQPWPFPGQLMLGFIAEYESGEIKVDGDEICEAHWYLPDNLPNIPAPGTIAGQLIRSRLTSQ